MRQEPVNSVSGDVGGVVQAGNIGGDVYLGARPARGSLPYRSAGVPPRTFGFQRRAAPELDALDVGSVVLSGLGGVGKTQAAADYVNRAWGAGDVELAGWVTASSRDRVVDEFARLAAVVSGVADEDPEAGVRRFLDWCATTTRPWLVVLDDVQDPADLMGLWPSGGVGRVVVTTRRRDASLRAADRRVVPLGVFTKDESVAYLGEMLADQPHVLDGAAELAELVGFLPLALGQAGAYVLDRCITCAEYVERWRGQRRTLTEMFPSEGALPDGRADTVATTWAMSVDLADGMSPVGLAGPVLAVASVLDPNGIPLSVFTSPEVLEYLSTGSGETVGAEKVRGALSCLHRLSLITLDTAPDKAHAAVRTHALVQHATRDRITDTRWPVLAQVATDALLNVWPEVERDTALAATLRANTAALADTAGTHLWHPDGHTVLFHAGSSLGRAGQVTAAVTYHDNLHTTANAHLGPDHPHTLTTRHNLANWRAKQATHWAQQQHSKHYSPTGHGY